MSADELFKPRYKLIADYPGLTWPIGQILYKHSKAAYWWCVDDSIFDGARGEVFEKYPHLFRKLEWWEERKREELPEYVRLNDKVGKLGDVYKGNLTGSAMIIFASHDAQVTSLSNLKPATYDEYRQYSTL